MDGLFRTVCRDCAEWQTTFEFAEADEFFDAHADRGHDVVTVNIAAKEYGVVSPL